MIALDHLKRLNLLTMEIYPPLSLELCDQLYQQFKMYYDILSEAYYKSPE